MLSAYAHLNLYCRLTLQSKKMLAQVSADFRHGALKNLETQGKEVWCRSRDLNPDTLAGARP